MRVDDLAARHAQLVEPGGPPGQLLAAADAERDVVEARAALVELLLAGQHGEAVQAEQGVAECVDHVPERAGVLVEDRLGAEYAGVPLLARLDVGDGDRDMGNGGHRGGVGHRIAPVVRLKLTRRASVRRATAEHRQRRPISRCPLPREGCPCRRPGGRPRAGSRRRAAPARPPRGGRRCGSTPPAGPAISALVRPSATSASTSSWRAVSPAGLARVSAIGPRGTRVTPSCRSRSRSRADSARGAQPVGDVQRADDRFGVAGRRERQRVPVRAALLLPVDRGGGPVLARAARRRAPRPGRGAPPGCRAARTSTPARRWTTARRSRRPAEAVGGQRPRRRAVAGEPRVLDARGRRRR